MKVRLTYEESQAIETLVTGQVLFGYLNFDGPCDFTFIGPHEGLVGELEYEGGESANVLRHGRLYWAPHWISRWPSSSLARVVLRTISEDTFKLVYLSVFREVNGGWSNNEFVTLVDRENLLPIGR